MKITAGYLEEQKRLHETTEYGTASVMYAPMVTSLIDKLGITELLDYGCGRGNLSANLKVGHQMTIQHYDPAVPECAGDPIPMQMVACIDVLEHIEPECLDAVLDDLKRCTGTVGFFSIATGPAVKTLSDGRNAHLIKQPVEWWWHKLSERFEIQTLQRVGTHGFYVIVKPKTGPLIEVPDDKIEWKEAVSTIV